MPVFGGPVITSVMPAKLLEVIGQWPSTGILFWFESDSECRLLGHPKIRSFASYSDLIPISALQKRLRNTE